MKIVAQAFGAVAAAFLVATAGANVCQAATVNLNSAILTGGASLIANDGRIKFDPNITGEIATFTLQSIAGTQYSIQVTGHNNQSSSFFQFQIDPDGSSGPSGFVQLGNNVNFGSGFNTVTLATFTNLGNSDLFQIINGGTGNSGGEISGLSITAVPLPAALPLRRWAWRVGSARPAQEAESYGDGLNLLLCPISPASAGLFRARAETRTVCAWVYSRAGSRFVSEARDRVTGGAAARPPAGGESPLRCATDCAMVLVGLPLVAFGKACLEELSPASLRGFCLGPDACSFRRRST